MTELVYAARGLANLVRLTDFLVESDPQAAQETSKLIVEALQILKQHPEIGRKVPFGQCELVISRGRTGYIALYRFSPPMDRVAVHRLRHQRESGYKS